MSSRQHKKDFEAWKIREANRRADREREERIEQELKQNEEMAKKLLEDYATIELGGYQFIGSAFKLNCFSCLQ